MKLGAFLGITDYVVILFSLIACAGIGIYHHFRGRKETKLEDYCLGGRNMTIWPVAFSMLATTWSAVPIVSGIAEISRYGMEYMSGVFGSQLGKIVVAYSVVPVFKYFNYISVYEYFEKRFDRSVRLGYSITYIIMNMFYAAVALYLPALLLTKVSEIPYEVMTTFLGIICTVYCILGGFRTVVWTDVLQSVFILTSLISIIIIGTISGNGPRSVYETSFKNTFFTHLRWFNSEDRVFTVFSSTIFGFFLNMQLFSTSQSVVQRLLSVKNVKSAKRSMLLAIFLSIIFSILCIAGGGVVYLALYRCDPIRNSKETGVTSMDLVLLYFVQEHLSKYPGLAGIVLAGIISSSLSTISSFINSFATILFEDFIRPSALGQKIKEGQEVLVSKIFTAIFGLIIIFLSFLIPLMGGALKAMISILGAMGGPLTGLMLLAMFSARAEKKSCLMGMITGIAFCLWLAIGSMSNNIPQQTLPYSSEDCEFNISSTTLTNTTFQIKRHVYIFPLYKISFVWYGPLGILVTIIVGLALSYLKKPNSEAVDLRLLSPVVHKYLNKSQEKELIKEYIEDNENEETKNLKETDI